MDNKLTTKKYWENYYNKNYGNKSHIISVCSFYDTFWEQLFGDDSKGKTIIEIGGFPGRYLAYLSSKYNLTESLQPILVPAYGTVITGFLHELLVTAPISINL